MGTVKSESAVSRSFDSSSAGAPTGSKEVSTSVVLLPIGAWSAGDAVCTRAAVLRGMSADSKYHAALKSLSITGRPRLSSATHPPRAASVAGWGLTLVKYHRALLVKML